MAQTHFRYTHKNVSICNQTGSSANSKEVLKTHFWESELITNNKEFTNHIILQYTLSVRLSYQLLRDWELILAFQWNFYSSYVPAGVPHTYCFCNANNSILFVLPSECSGIKWSWHYFYCSNDKSVQQECMVFRSHFFAQNCTLCFCWYYSSENCIWFKGELKFKHSVCISFHRSHYTNFLIKYKVLVFRELGSAFRIKDFSNVKVKGVTKHSNN